MHACIGTAQTADNPLLRDLIPYAVVEGRTALRRIWVPPLKVAERRRLIAHTFEFKPILIV